MKKHLLFPQLTILSLLFSSIFFLSSYAQNCAPTIEWEKSLGGDTTDRASSVLQTTDGSYIVAGYTASSDSDVSVNHGNADYWVVKLASDGSLTWQVALGGSHEEIAHSIIQSADGGYVIAGSTKSNNGNVTDNHGAHDFWVVKLDGDGNIIWQKALGGSGNDIAYEVSETNDSGYVVAGLTYSSDGDVTFNHGQDDYWVVKLNSGGNLDWQKTFGGTGKDEAYSVKQTIDSGYIVAGSSSSNDSDVTGNQGLNDYWIVKLDNAGNISWQKTFGGTKDDVASSVQQTNDGGYVVAGYSASTSGDVTDNHGTNDYWIIKMDNSGTLVWQKALGGGLFDAANEIHQTADGGYVTVGTTTSNNGDVTGNHGGIDYWVTKQDVNGDLSWQRTLGGSSDDGGFSIKQTVDDGFIVAGYSSSLDGDVTGNNGHSDFWVVKLTADVNVVNTYYADLDGDGYGDPNNSIDTNLCSPPPGYLIDHSDCNDGDAAINPAATETCNGFDDNCNGTIDEGVTNTYFADVDDDGYGDANNTVAACSPPVGFVTDSSDCNDNNPTIHPEGVEVCNGLDDDCNNLIDDGLPTTTYYADVDDDGYGNVNSSVNSCMPPVGFVTDSTDCNDNNPQIHPEATEICNGLDDDCNNLIDDGLPTITYYIDADGDGYGNPNISLTYCSQPSGYVTDSTDCDDSNPNVNPGVLEVSNNGVDDNCNGVIDEFGVGINEIAISPALTIFPNPAADQTTLKVKFENASIENVKISITNLLGEIKFENILPCTNGTLHEEISLGEKFTDGMYLIQVSCGQQHSSTTLVVAK